MHIVCYKFPSSVNMYLVKIKDKRNKFIIASEFYCGT